MKKAGNLIVISGFSGAGKGTVVKELLKNGDYAYSVSATTRKIREGEKDGVSYFFLTREKFESMIAQQELLEWNEYSGNYYGTPKQFILDQLAGGKNMLLEIDPHGALNVKKAFPDAVLIFITAPSMQDVEARLRGRGTETEESIHKRLSQTRWEMDQMEQYDFIVVNDELMDCVHTIESIVDSMSYRVCHQADLVALFREQIAGMGYSE